MDNHRGQTKADLLELHEELHVVKEGYEFLDEKRFLLASEIRKLMQQYKEAEFSYEKELESAHKDFSRLESAYGLEYLQVEDIKPSQFDYEIDKRNFLGVKLEKLSCNIQAGRRDHLSLSIKQMAGNMESIIKLAIRLGNMARQLRLLTDDYTLTQRRARALENIIIPEINQNIKRVNDALEELDMEEAIRVRLLNN